MSLASVQAGYWARGDGERSRGLQRFGALSNGMALLTHQEEAVIGAVNFVLLPLTFLSSVFMAQSPMPKSKDLLPAKFLCMCI